MPSFGGIPPSTGRKTMCQCARRILLLVGAIMAAKQSQLGVTSRSTPRSSASAVDGAARRVRPAPGLLTSEQAAEYLQICPRTLWTLRDEKKIAHVLIGPRIVRYEIAALNEYIESVRVPVTRRCQSPPLEVPTLTSIDVGHDTTGGQL